MGEGEGLHSETVESNDVMGLSEKDLFAEFMSARDDVVEIYRQLPEVARSRDYYEKLKGYDKRFDNAMDKMLWAFVQTIRR